MNDRLKDAREVMNCVSKVQQGLGGGKISLSDEGWMGSEHWAGLRWMGVLSYENID